ncbi:MAG: class I SAM-dependent methyltransferase [Ktedonobacteraceae bacterium]
MLTQSKIDCALEINHGKRFEFGKNWSQFLTILDEKRIAIAEQSLQEMLAIDHLQGKSFLDIGSGSGLFSLAARRLGATVHSFDFDPQAAACSAELKERYFSGDPSWTIEEGSVLDLDYLSSLGTFDIVYSWGVLHHTGALWQALEHAYAKVAAGGYLFIALYNDQGRATRNWKVVKQTYNLLPHGLKFLVLWPAFVHLWGPIMCRDFLHGRPFSTWLNYKTRRGMSAWRDVVDWVGGYPFEVATPGDVFEFYRKKGLQLIKLKSSNAHGCNEYVFVNQ